MNYNLQIQKILLQMEELKNFDDKVRALKEAIQLADAHQDVEWGFDLRLDLIREERNTSKCVESFPAFAWLLNARDSEPDLFEESEFLWEYKWMVTSACRNASLTKEQVLDIADDLKVRLLRNGYTARAYYNVMTSWYLHNGDLQQARATIELADAEMVDDMTNCPACELDTRVELELLEANFDKAVVMAHDLIHKKVTCFYMPFQTYCCLAYYLLRGGEHKRAKEYFDLALEEFEATDKYDSSIIFALSILIYYMARTNHPATWSYFERISTWAVDAEDVHQLTFGQNVLPLLSGDGTQSLQLSTQLPYYRQDGVYSLEALRSYYYNTAYAIAQRFDLRNGHPHFQEQLEHFNRERNN